MTKSSEVLKLQHALEINNAIVRAHEQNSEDAEDGGDTGTGTATGGQGTVIEKIMFIDVFNSIQAGEKQFGIVDHFDADKYLAQASPGLNGELGQHANSGLKAHPLLSQLSKFDGDTPNMSMDPSQNPEAQNRNENRLRLQMSLQQRQQQSMQMKPGG